VIDLDHDGDEDLVLAATNVSGSPKLSFYRNTSAPAHKTPKLTNMTWDTRPESEDFSTMFANILAKGGLPKVGEYTHVWLRVFTQDAYGQPLNPVARHNVLIPIAHVFEQTQASFELDLVAPTNFQTFYNFVLCYVEIDASSKTTKRGQIHTMFFTPEEEEMASLQASYPDLISEGTPETVVVLRPEDPGDTGSSGSGSSMGPIDRPGSSGSSGG
jgi:hypothetical protein